MLNLQKHSDICPANRVSQIKEYYFSKKLKEVADMNAKGLDVISLGIGSPDRPPHIRTIDALCEDSRKEDAHGYQPYIGIPALREAFSDWYKRWYGVELTPKTEIQPLIGSKEGILHISLAFLNPGDGVLVPNPGYPTYTSVSKLAEAHIINYELTEKNGWLPDFEAIEKNDLSNVNLMWVNYPHMPTGTPASINLFERLVAFGKKHNIIIINDNPYSFILNEKPLSILSVPGAKDICIEMNSMSKAHNMPGWRIGMLASNAEFDSAIAEDALFNYGKLQYELGGGRFNEAIQVLNRYVAQYPSSPRVRTAKELLAAAYYNSHNYDEAYEIIASYPDPDGDLLAAKQKIAYFRGLSALEKGDTEGAGRYLAESARIGISPKYNALATFWQGEIAYGRGNYDVALRDYESYLKRAPKTEPEYAMAFYNTGYCHFSKENMPRARESFVRFIELYPTQDGYRTDARNRLGDTYYSDRQFDEALKYYGQAAAASDDGADYARYQRAVTLGILGRTSEKIKALQQIIRDGRGDYLDDATYELGRTFVAQERYREGAAVLEPFVETYVYSPYRSAALSELGLAYLNLGDKKKSLSYYDMVVKTAPQSSDAKDALQGIRDIYVSEGDAGGYFDYARKSGAEGDLTAMSRDSLSFAAARRIYLSGEPASAAKSLRSYLESYPKGYYTADALYCLSDCYLKTGERSRAIETLAALAGAGQNQYTHRALKTLAGMTFADERFTEAAAAYRKLADAESTAAGKAEAMNGYVRATIAAGDEERILSMADDVASYTAAGDEAWRASQFAKAGILDRRGDAAAAQKIYKVLSANVKTPEGAESAYRVVESAFRAGDTARAEKLVLDFSDKGTPHAFWLAKSFLVLGDIYVQKGDMFQARATYQSIVDGYTPADDGIVAEAKEKIKKLN